MQKAIKMLEELRGKITNFEILSVQITKNKTIVSKAMDSKEYEEVIEQPSKIFPFTEVTLNPLNCRSCVGYMMYGLTVEGYCEEDLGDGFSFSYEGGSFKAQRRYDGIYQIYIP